MLPFNHGLGAWGPLFSGVMMVWQEKGKFGLRTLLKNSFNPFPIQFLFIAFVSPFLLFGVASLLTFYIDKYPLEIRNSGKTKEFPTFNLLSYFIFNLIFFGLGEELGWKGIALPKLQRKYNALLSSLIFTFSGPSGTGLCYCTDQVIQALIFWNSRMDDKFAYWEYLTYLDS